MFQYLKQILTSAILLAALWISAAPASVYFGAGKQTLQAISHQPDHAKLFYASSNQSQLSSHLYRQLQSIFKGLVSFKHPQKSHYHVIYDGAGHILLATVNNGHGTFQAIRYTNSRGYTGYYTPNGEALLKSTFLKAPLKYIRISDKFTSHRWHPILHIIRPHYGIDYAAPWGTPIRAIGSGMVSFAGNDGGYGKVVVIRHNNRYQSLYGHISHFAQWLKPGQWVSQGQIIGYVGMTGLATGPHLHFGLYDYGRAVNPEKILNHRQSPSIATRDLPDFFAKSNRLYTHLAAIQRNSAFQG